MGTTISVSSIFYDTLLTNILPLNINTGQYEYKQRIPDYILRESTNEYKVS